VREGGEVGWRCLLGREGRWTGGLLQMRAEKKQEEERKELGCGRKGRERVFDFFSFFSNPFQIFFKPF
jgi:hypothetical protein